jgi:hypothetical protein
MKKVYHGANSILAEGSGDPAISACPEIVRHPGSPHSVGAAVSSTSAAFDTSI